MREKPAGKIQTDQAGYLAEHVQYADLWMISGLFSWGPDVFLNPVTDGGGIKTKLVEALGYNLTAVSSLNRAIGVDPGLSPGKLLVADHADWEGFARMIRGGQFNRKYFPGFFNHFIGLILQIKQRISYEHHIVNLTY